MELSEEVVDEFMEEVPMSVRLAKFCSKTGKKFSSKSENNSGNNRPKPDKNQRKEKGLKVRVEKDNLIDNELETYVADSDSY